MKTNEQETALSAQTTNVLPVIPEQEHCHVGATTVQGMYISYNSSYLPHILGIDCMQYLLKINYYFF